jgi:two-component system, OmpR family, phosphate regulon sensor histidine kinase PhoR
VTESVDGHDDAGTLRARLAEANDTLRAIQQGEVDALIVHDGDGDRVYTLHTADEPYRHLVEQMQEGAIVLAVTGDILYCNAQFASLVGKSLETVTGSRFDRFVHEGDKDAFLALLSAGSGRQRGQLIGSDAGTIEVCLSLTTTASNSADRLSLIVTDLREIQEAFRTRDLAEHNTA